MSTIETATENGLKPGTILMDRQTHAALTAEHLTEAADAVVRAGLAISDIDTVPVLNTLPSVQASDETPINFTAARKGIRTVGVRKLNVINTLAKAIAKLNAEGVNTDYVLKHFTDWKGPIKTPTKKISGIISQLNSFQR